MNLLLSTSQHKIGLWYCVWAHVHVHMHASSE